MNAPRCLFGSSSLGEISILAGGCDSRGNILISTELYNLEAGTWKSLLSMNKPHKKCSGVFMDAVFYVIGGIGGAKSEWLTCEEEYDPEIRTWTQIQCMYHNEYKNDTHATYGEPLLVAVISSMRIIPICIRRHVLDFQSIFSFPDHIPPHKSTTLI
ncbi:hypothetical protein R3W88_004378 [Solanum pinnatisectum]|uniref:Uncharacterized protein n=1 Tax=Solanum pinnatisectum TaxID=50273 RepID=A0AAV9KBI5_9SOLN|nr:hypothetical protein R3W88_004378 [Solanum pinnatisectum]